MDLLLQYHEEKHVAEENSAMEWSDILFETGETYVGQTNCEEVAGLEMKWTNTEVETDGIYMGHNNWEDMAGKLLDMIGLEMEWTNIEVETGEMYMGL